MEQWNYFNYFTEIEEYFWKKRGSHLLVSPLDWAIMETWQKAGVPLDAVLKGIDKAFESYARSRRGAGKALKSLAYCTDAVLDAAEEAQEAAAGKGPSSSGANSGAKRSPFERSELREYLQRNAESLRSTGETHTERAELVTLFEEASRTVEYCLTLVDSPGALDVEDLERRLTTLDERIHAGLMLYAGEEIVMRIRREMDNALAAYRRKMRAEQLALVEKQFLQKRLLEEFRIPRLSLFYLT